MSDEVKKIKRDPCWHCERRHINCHAYRECGDYWDAVEENRKEKEAMRFKEETVPKRMLDNLKVGWRR